MKLSALVAICLLFSSCGVMDMVRDVRVRYETAKAFYDDAKDAYHEAKAEADTDGDGKVSMDEWGNWIFLLLLGGGQLLRNKRVTKDLDELYDKTHKPVQL